MNPSVGGSSPPSRLLERKSRGGTPGVMTPGMAGSTPVRSAKRVPKLYCVVRRDLPKGLRAAQAAHALIEFTLRVPERVVDNLVILESCDEEALAQLVDRGRDLGFELQPFFEPDVDDELTACAFAPEAWQILSSLPLAYRDDK